MQPLHFPSYPFRTRRVERGVEIWDIIRKKWLLLTPEEWVRQHTVAYLINDLQYPQGLISVERSLKVNGLQKRADIVVFDKTSIPFLLVECKAPEIEISQGVFDQAARYNLTLKVPYLMVTNGLRHFCAQINPEECSWNYLQDLPAFKQ
jgi:hypothetical protein